MIIGFLIFLKNFDSFILYFGPLPPSIKNFFKNFIDQTCLRKSWRSNRNSFSRSGWKNFFTSWHWKCLQSSNSTKMAKGIYFGIFSWQGINGCLLCSNSF